MSRLDLKSYEEFKEKVVNSDSPVLVDFYAVWCGPCKLTAPVIEEIASEAEGFEVYKVDVDSIPQAAADFGIASIPTIISFKNGAEYKRQVGFADKAALLGLLS